MDMKELSQRIGNMSAEEKQTMSDVFNKEDTSLKNSKAAAHNKMCRSTQAALEECFSKAVSLNVVVPFCVCLLSLLKLKPLFLFWSGC
jgi:hypothetical protein